MQLLRWSWCTTLPFMLALDCHEPTPPVEEETPTIQLLGQLPKPYADMLSEDWVDMAQRSIATAFAQTGRTVKRVCVGCEDDSLTVNIAAAADAWRVSGVSIPSNGVVVARILGFNSGSNTDATEAVYGFPNGQFIYLIVLLPKPGTDGEWRIVRLSWTLTSGTYAFAFQGEMAVLGDYVACPGHPQQQRADADFRTCDDAMSSHRSQTLAAVHARASAPIWITCAAGCCTAAVRLN